MLQGTPPPPTFGHVGRANWTPEDLKCGGGGLGGYLEGVAGRERGRHDANMYANMILSNNRLQIDINDSKTIKVLGYGTSEGQFTGAWHVGHLGLSPSCHGHG